MKRQVNKSLAIQELHNCRLAPIIFFTNQWNAKCLGLPYSIRYPTIIFIIYYKEKVQYFNNNNVITLMKTKKGQKVNWAQIIFNNLCSELDRWYRYVKDNKGDKKKNLSICRGIGMLRIIKGIKKKLVNICLCMKRRIHIIDQPRLKELGRRCR